MNQPEITKIISQMIQNREPDEKILRTLVELSIDPMMAQQLISASHKSMGESTRVVSSRKALIIETYGIASDGVRLEVSVLQTSDDFVLHYYLNFPEYGEGTKALLSSLKRTIISEASFKTDKLLDPKFVVSLKERFRQQAEAILKKENPKLDETTKQTLVADLIHEMLGLGKIEFLLADGNLEEIVINSAKEPVWVYSKKYGWLKTNVQMGTEDEIQNYASIIARRVGKQVTVLNPLLDAHLITGDRANATLFPISSAGNTITIRRFRRDPWTVTDFIKSGTVNSEIMALMWLAMQYELNVIISGGTASGKCVSGDTRIQLAGGKKRAEDLFNQLQTESEIVYETPNEIVFDVLQKKCKIFSLNKQTAQIEEKPIQYAWKLKGGKTLKVTLEDGLAVETTPEHKFVTYNGTRFLDKPADKLQRNDLIVCPAELQEGIEQQNTAETAQNQQTISATSVLHKTQAIRVVPVKEITEGFAETVYDFTVPDTHNFVAEGIFIHNTSLMNVLVPFIQPNQRIITIEDSVAAESEILYRQNDQTVKTTVGELIDGIIEDDSITDVALENDEGIEIPSMSPNGKIEWRAPSHFIRHRVEKDLLTITCASGRQIKVTPDHSLFGLDENGKIAKVSGNMLQQGAWLATPRKMDWIGRTVRFDLRQHLQAFKGCFMKSLEIQPLIEQNMNALRVHMPAQNIRHA
ncbi:MAG: ATPase, T2SS/T4P/T4SS family, partial [Candidatus Diapherotrites archaeon]|nr:ATPase, T2SS/T4P/T4SS family [Candidatus Diapherotrites archaeon]